MKDVCNRICGETNFTYNYVDNDYEDELIERSYNKGRMALMLYKDSASYISFSEKEIRGRNSSVQSVPTAYNIYYMSPHPKKHLYYYFLNLSGNPETDYIANGILEVMPDGYGFLRGDNYLSTPNDIYMSGTPGDTPILLSLKVLCLERAGERYGFGTQK